MRRAGERTSPLLHAHPPPAPALTSRAVSILISVVSLVSSCSVTSEAVILEVCSVFTSCTSSKREPVASFSSLREGGKVGVRARAGGRDRRPAQARMPAPSLTCFRF